MRSTDIANMMDATVIYAEESFLTATSISPKPTIAAIKSDYCHPMDTASVHGVPCGTEAPGDQPKGVMCRYGC